MINSDGTRCISETYLLCAGTKLTGCIRVVEFAATEHLLWLSVSLARILLGIAAHMGGIHLRSAVLVVWRAHVAML